MHHVEKAHKPDPGSRCAGGQPCGNGPRGHVPQEFLLRASVRVRLRLCGRAGVRRLRRRQPGVPLRRRGG